MKCPFCGHPDRIHAGPGAKTLDPGTCCCHPPDTPCHCPGWRYWLKGHDRQEQLQLEQERVDRAWGESAHTLYEESD